MRFGKADIWFSPQAPFLPIEREKDKQAMNQEEKEGECVPERERVGQFVILVKMTVEISYHRWCF